MLCCLVHQLSMAAFVAMPNRVQGVRFKMPSYVENMLT